MSQIVKLTANMSVAIRDVDSNEQKIYSYHSKGIKIRTESQEYWAIGTFVALWLSSILFYLFGGGLFFP